MRGVCFQAIYLYSMNGIIFYDNHIDFQNQSFPCRKLRLHGGDPDFENCEYLIGTLSLENKIFNSDGHFCSKVAELIDENIFFYVDDACLEKTDEELNEIIIKSVA